MKYLQKDLEKKTNLKKTQRKFWKKKVRKMKESPVKKVSEKSAKSERVHSKM